MSYPAFVLQHDYAAGDKVEFEIRCSYCGFGLCHVSTTLVTRRRKMNAVLVDPCPRCMRQGKDPSRADKKDWGVIEDGDYAGLVSASSG